MVSEWSCKYANEVLNAFGPCIYSFWMSRKPSKSYFSAPDQQPDLPFSSVHIPSCQYYIAKNIMCFIICHYPDILLNKFANYWSQKVAKLVPCLKTRTRKWSNEVIKEAPSSELSRCIIIYLKITCRQSCNISSKMISSVHRKLSMEAEEEIKILDILRSVDVVET